MKNIIVTGGAGFIGSHLVKSLDRPGNRILAIDDLSRGDTGKLDGVSDRVKFLKFDLATTNSYEHIFQGYDTVYNLAALNTGIGDDPLSHQEIFEQNMLLQMFPLKAAVKAKTVSRFIQISSAIVYARKSMENQVPTPENADTSNPEPSKIGYAMAKKLGEYLSKWYIQRYPIKISISRFINVYGEQDHYDDLGHFIPVIIRKVLQAKDSFSVFGSGNQKRSFMYVDDAVSALQIIAKKGGNGEVYNVDGGEEHSVKEVVETLLDITNKKNLTISYDTSKPEGSKRRMLDSSKLMALGWKPSISFRTGLSRTVDDIKMRLETNNI